MNISNLLNMPEKKNYIQLVQHIDKVPKSKIKFPLYGQIKKDGVCCVIVVIDTVVEVFGRSGKKLSNSDIIKKKFKEHCKNLNENKVYVAEVCNTRCSLEVLSGILNPNRVESLSEVQKELLDDMEIWYHDCLDIQDVVSGNNKEQQYRHRFEKLTELINSDNILHIILINDYDQLDHFFLSALDFEEEGIVIKQPGEGWEAGHKGYRSMKMVRKVSYDLECVGYEEGSGKYKGKISNLLFRFRNNNTIKAMLGKGWSQKDAENLYREAVNESTLSPVGKVYKVEALSDSSTDKGLRLPKVREERIDKLVPDY